MRATKPSPEQEANADREQVRKLFEALKVELEQAGSRADEVIDRLRKKFEQRTPREPVRLVKGGQR